MNVREEAKDPYTQATRVRRLAAVLSVRAPLLINAVALLATVLPVGCRRDLRSAPVASAKSHIVWQESFGESEGVPQQWLADAPAMGKASFALAEGRRGKGLRLVSAQPAERAVQVMRTLDATWLRGARLRVSAFARVASHHAGHGEMRIAVARPRNVSSAWDQGSGLVRLEDAWSPVAAVVDVPLDATSIEIALVAIGTIDITFDDLELEASRAPANDAGGLRSEARDRLVALIQMLGYLRFFYPGDGAAATDWQALEIEAVARILAVQNTSDGERELASLLARITPHAAIYREGAAPPLVEPGGADAMLTRWVHVGFGSTDPYWSFRTGIDEPPSVGVRLSLRKPLSEIGNCKRASARLLMESAEGTPTVHVEIAPIVPGVRAPPTATEIDVNHTTAEVDVPPDAFGVAFGVFMRGIGRIHVARLELSCDGRAVAEIKPSTAVVTSGVANHLYTVTRDHRCGSQTCMRIERQPELAFKSHDILDVSIGEGLRLRMPLVAWNDGKHTVPAHGAPVIATQLPASARASRLAAVLDLWVMLRWFYPYFADMHIDWEAALRPALDEAAMATTSDMQRHALSRLTAVLRDDHARVVRPDIDDGLLPVLFRTIDDRIVVAATLPATTDIPLGSTVISIDGVPAAEARRRAAELMSAATPAFELRHSTYTIAYGRKGTFARITFREPGGSRDVTRLVPRLDRSELVPKLREPRPASGTQLAGGVFYVDLHTLDDATWTSVLPRLTSASAIIFDLRGYVGPAAFVPLAYLADREIRSPMYLVPVVSPSGPPRYEHVRTYTPPRKLQLHARAIFLTDARAASAPETILGYVRGERLGIIIGEPTGGTNGNVIEYKLIGNMSMRFTGLRVLNHDGTVLHGHGFVPDITARPTLAGIIAGRDEVLETAVAFAQRESAATSPP